MPDSLAERWRAYCDLVKAPEALASSINPISRAYYSGAYDVLELLLNSGMSIELAQTLRQEYLNYAAERAKRIQEGFQKKEDSNARRRRNREEKLQ